MRTRFGIESTGARWDAKTNPRDYGIAPDFGSGLRDVRTLLGISCEMTETIAEIPY